jgi:hypothetical protein
MDSLCLAELKNLVLELFAERAEFQRTIGALRDEIARLKGGPGRPDISANVKPESKPSGMEKASQAQPSNGAGKRRRRGSTRAARPLARAVQPERKQQTRRSDRTPGAAFARLDRVFQRAEIDMANVIPKQPSGMILTNQALQSHRPQFEPIANRLAKPRPSENPRLLRRPLLVKILEEPLRHDSNSQSTTFEKRITTSAPRRQNNRLLSVYDDARVGSFRNVSDLVGDLLSRLFGESGVFGSALAMVCRPAYVLAGDVPDLLGAR